ncbi:MAG: rhomboid family intramembrane serine protease [Burkholderiales bacterium]
MHIHATDPVHAQSPEVKADFQAAWILAVAFVAVLGIVFAANEALGLGLQRFGVAPRTLPGLFGVLAAPLLHADFAHLLSNALPIAIAGTALLFLYPDSSRVVLPAIYLGPGVAVWLFGRESIHIGASGLVYGLVSYVFVAGLLRRDRRAIAASLLVAFLYGALVWGVLPIKVGVSWETHLAAAAIGVVLAFALRARDVPPRKRYSWEDEPAGADDADGEWNVPPEPADTGAPPLRP